jgi:Flp pilus assembly protein TadD
MARVPDSAIWMAVPYVFVNYLAHLVAPFYLSLIYGTSFVMSPLDARFLLPFALVIGLVLLLWYNRRRIGSQVWVALALLVVPLLPVLNLKVFHAEYIIQDRYLYLPSIGFCYLTAMGIVRLAEPRRQLALGLAALVLVAYGASTVLQNRVWHDPVALWQRAIAYAPNSWSTHYNLGLAFLNLKQHEAARSELTEAQRLNPREPNVYNNLAAAQGALGDTDSAIKSLREALALDPQSPEAHNNLGSFLFNRGDYAEATPPLSLRITIWRRRRPLWEIMTRPYANMRRCSRVRPMTGRLTIVSA